MVFSDRRIPNKNITQLNKSKQNDLLTNHKKPIWKGVPQPYGGERCFFFSDKKITNSTNPRRINAGLARVRLLKSDGIRIYPSPIFA